MQEDPHLHLLWVGDGWWSKRLMERVADLGLADQVHTPGLVAPTEIPGWIRTMNVVAHPSYREGLPRAVVQGLLSARPVVAYDLDGAPEVCIDGETGFLVKPGDLAGLRTSVERLREDPELAARMGRAGRERCRIDFDHRTMVQELDDLYGRILEGRRINP